MILNFKLKLLYKLFIAKTWAEGLDGNSAQGDLILCLGGWILWAGMNGMEQLDKHNCGQVRPLTLKLGHSHPLEQAEKEA